MSLIDPPLMACPQCGSTDTLGTTEEILGKAGCTVYADGNIEHDGETKIWWDTSTTVGFECSCGWSGAQADLVPAETED